MFARKSIPKCVLVLLCLAIPTFWLCACGGGATSTVQIQSNPTPVIGSLSPSSITAGSAATTVTVNGSGFIPSSTVQWNQSNRATTFVGSQQLQVALTAADLAAGATGQIVVVNPAPGGGASNLEAFQINNPTPQVTSISPAALTLVNAGSVVTIMGNGFLPTTSVLWNGVTHASTYVSAGELQLTVQASDVAGVGNVQIAVVNPAPGGGASPTSPIGIVYPMPQITSLSPASVSAGASAQTLTVNGIGFATTSVVQFNGTARPTTYLNSNTLTIALSASDLATPATVQITVFTGAPGGGTTPPADVTIIQYAVPVLTSIDPASVAINSPDTPVSIQGSGFTAASMVQVNGSAVSMNGWTTNQLFFILPAGDLTSLGTLSVTANNPGTAESNSLTITVTPNPVPTATALSPASAANGGSDFAVTVTGSSFVPTSIVQWNGSPRATTYVSSSLLTVAIGAQDIQSLGNNNVTVFNSAPGGGASAPLVFTTYLALPNNDLIYDPSRKLLWAAVPSSAGSLLGNTVVSIDPYTGLLGTPIWVGSEPYKLAISGDGTTLWVGFIGTPSAREINLTSGTPTSAQPYFPGGWGGNVYATNLAVLPGTPSSVAIATGFVSIYDGGTERSQTSTAGATYLTFGPSASTLYGYSSDSLAIFSIDSSGITSST